jgi:hypothetical protein
MVKHALKIINFFGGRELGDGFFLIFLFSKD